jgi:hypothetical protein
LWNAFNSTVTTNTISSPNGTTTADTFTKLFDTGNLQQNFNFNGTYTYSVFLKKGNLDFAFLFAAGFIGYFNLSNGTLGSVTAGATTKITPFVNGWYRCEMTFTATTSSSFRIYTSQSETVGGIGFMYVWGAQLEAGSNATSYIPTVASAVTRNADVISKTGISDLIGQTEGTLFANFSQNLGSRILALRSNNSQNRIALRITSSTNLGVEVVSQGSLIYTDSANVSLTSNTFFKILVTYTNTKIKMFVNGLLVLESGVVNFSPNEMLSILALGISELNFSTSNLNGSIKEAVVFKTALTDTECIQLTTI